MSKSAVLLNDLSMKSYLEMNNYLSGSALSYFPDRPDLYRYKYIDGADKIDSDSLKIGRLTHTLFLEPEKYDQEYHLIPKSYINDKGKDIKWIEKRGSKHVEEDINIANGRCRIKESQLQEAAIYCESLDAHYMPLSEEKLIESTMLYKGGHLNFKSRPDVLYPDIGIADNIKTSSSINPAVVFKSAIEHGYDISAALTAYCFKKTFDKDLKDYRFVVVEKSELAPVKIFSSNQPMFGEGSMTFIQFGAKRLTMAIEKYLWCVDNNCWKPYSNVPDIMKIPYFKYEEIFGDDS